ncbi:MAG TPA: PLDc N-terminal domain-containing protein [Candidatus Saccharimonadales bacterium]|nr:PLDc N-terminal domain-containing protein [Candidatus Saccharimonadales bacterium]
MALLLIFIPLIILALVITVWVFWIWMLIHVIQSDDPNKLVWVIVIVLTHFIGALIYYFLAYRQPSKSK